MKIMAVFQRQKSIWNELFNVGLRQTSWKKVYLLFFVSISGNLFSQTSTHSNLEYSTLRGYNFWEKIQIEMSHYLSISQFESNSFIKNNLIKKVVMYEYDYEISKDFVALLHSQDTVYLPKKIWEYSKSGLLMTENYFFFYNMLDTGINYQEYGPLLIRKFNYNEENYLENTKTIHKGHVNRSTKINTCNCIPKEIIKAFDINGSLTSITKACQDFDVLCTENFEVDENHLLTKIVYSENGQPTLVHHFIYEYFDPNERPIR